MARQVSISCKNIFKSTDKSLLAKELTAKWIDIINYMERDINSTVKK